MIDNVTCKTNVNPPFKIPVEDKTTVRDEMAMAALAGMDMSSVGNTPKMIAKFAYAIANAMMRERKEQSK
jgi:hypothetical protein